MPEPRATILVVDDEPDLRLALRALLRRAEFGVEEAQDGRAGLRAVHDLRPDVVLLDVEMPEMDGWAALERIRELDDALPVIMLTAHGLEMEKVRGLRAGADDYLVKPFGNQELLARIDLVLGRRPERPPERYADANVEVDFARRAVRAHGEEIELTSLEFRLLTAFVRQADTVVAHDELVRSAWAASAGVGPDQVRSAVRHLRRRLGWKDGGPVQSVRGVGYRYLSGA